MTSKCRLFIIHWHVSIEFYECTCWLTESCDRRGCQKTDLQRKFNYGIKLLNKIRDMIKLEYGPALNEDFGDVSCHHVSCIVLNPIKSNSNSLLVGFVLHVYSLFCQREEKGLFQPS